MATDVARLSTKKLLAMKAPPELEDVPRIGLDENGALFKCVRSAEHWFQAYTTTETNLQATEQLLLIARARLALLRWPRLTILVLAALNVAQGVAAVLR